MSEFVIFDYSSLSRIAGVRKDAFPGAPKQLAPIKPIAERIGEGEHPIHTWSDGERYQRESPGVWVRIRDGKKDHGKHSEIDEHYNKKLENYHHVPEDVHSGLAGLTGKVRDAALDVTDNFAAKIREMKLKAFNLSNAGDHEGAATIKAYIDDLTKRVREVVEDSQKEQQENNAADAIIPDEIKDGMQDFPRSIREPFEVSMRDLAKRIIEENRAEEDARAIGNLKEVRKRRLNAEWAKEDMRRRFDVEKRKAEEYKQKIGIFKSAKDRIESNLMKKPKTSEVESGLARVKPESVVPNQAKSYNPVFVVETESGKAVFKPHLFAESLHAARKSIPKSEISSDAREVLTYEVDRALGTNLVPETVMIYVPMGKGVVDNYTMADDDILRDSNYDMYREAEPGEYRGSIMKWVPDAPAYGLANTERRNLADSPENREQWHNLMALDYIVGATDRHYKNLLVDKTGKIYAIDNGFNFPKGNDISQLRSGDAYEHTDGGKISKSVRDRLKKINPEKLKSLVSQVLDEEDTKGVMERFNDVVSGKELAFPRPPTW